MKKSSILVAATVSTLVLLALMLLDRDAQVPGETKNSPDRTAHRVRGASATGTERSTSESETVVGQQAPAGEPVKADPIAELQKAVPAQPTPSADQSWLSYEFQTWSYICERHALTLAAADEVRMLLKQEDLSEETRKRYNRFVRDTEELDEGIARKAVCYFL